MGSTPIRPSDLLDPAGYERVRAARLREIITLKTLRRVDVGPWVSFVFENRATVLHQIQEMVRVERITDAAKLEHEIETYCELLPGPRELSATMFIEITDEAQRREALSKLGGVEGKVSIKVGARPFPARDKRPIAPEFARQGLATCVYYLGFPLDARAASALRAGREPVWIEVAHPVYGHAGRLSAETVRSLAKDLG